jgi:hypothetical protein
MEIVPEVKAMLGLICPKEGMDMDEMQRFKSVIREMCHLDGDKKQGCRNHPN